MNNTASAMSPASGSDSPGAAGPAAVNGPFTPRRTSRRRGRAAASGRYLSVGVTSFVPALSRSRTARMPWRAVMNGAM